jgi:hypothetical protein
MVSGAILMISQDTNISERLQKDLVWERDEGDFKLRSILQINNESYKRDEKV